MIEFNIIQRDDGVMHGYKCKSVADAVHWMTSPQYLHQLSKQDLRDLCARLMPVISRKFRKQ